MQQGETNIVLVTPPDCAHAAGAYGLPLAQLCYRIGNGPHLFRAHAAAPRGGLMVVGDDHFDGQGDAGGFCREVIAECTARRFSGLVLDLEAKPTKTIAEIIRTLSAHCARNGWHFYLPEAYGNASDTAYILISSAISGATLKERLDTAVARYGASRVVLCISRAAEDFYLPAPEGKGRPLTREALRARMRERAPAVFFSNELCAHYFTYMSAEDGAHFVLFDDVGSIQQKMRLAEQLGVRQFFLFYAQLDDLMPGLFPKRQ